MPKIVIDIPDENYKRLKEYDGIIDDFWCEAILDGTVLPKGHGDLISRDDTLEAMDTWDKFGYTPARHLIRITRNVYVPYVHYDDMVRAVKGMEAIVEADKE